ncbi:MAG: PfkB family carbohydrate kinase [Bifidobacterium tsurumiense]|uniref:PfkB family carbohydrate kinase n=1 Tax=Bifidobacterium tsurumiense TaxID=356829 RepID=UPI002A8133D5|nr:PfkB family carbohydrate kinase [Bifidobacterium tsurumiense]MDY4677449.1 PfkB family carbohydrate kinase [Bifidobacterium tsurumiense]
MSGNQSEPATERERQIYEWIRQNPMISQQELAQLAGITRSGVAAHISNLTKKGYVRGKGYILAPERYVAVVGGVSMDVMGEASRDITQYSSNPGHVHYVIGGVGRNIAVALQQLGVTNSFISVYGDDHNGEQFKIEAANRGMDIAYSQQLSGSATASYMYINCTDGSRAIALDDMGIFAHMTPAFLEERLPVIANAEMLVLDTNLQAEAIEWLCGHVDRPLFARAVSEEKAVRLRNVLARLEALVLDTAESEAISGIKAQDVDSGIECARRILEAGVSRVLVGIVGVGMIFGCSEGLWLYSDSRYVKGNANGSGDAAMGALAWAWLEGYDAELQGKCAAAASFMSCDSIESVHEYMDIEAVIEQSGRITTQSL